MNFLKNMLLSRLKEKSTWATIITVIGSVTGAQIAPELADIITSGGLAIVAAIAFFTKEAPKA